MPCDKYVESNIHAPVLLNLLYSLGKRDKMLGEPHILSLFPNMFNKIQTHLRFISFYVCSGNYEAGLFLTVKRNPHQCMTQLSLFHINHPIVWPLQFSARVRP